MFLMLHTKCYVPLSRKMKEDKFIPKYKEGSNGGLDISSNTQHKLAHVIYQLCSVYLIRWMWGFYSAFINEAFGHITMY